MEQTTSYANTASTIAQIKIEVSNNKILQAQGAELAGPTPQESSRIGASHETTLPSNEEGTPVNDKGLQQSVASANETAPQHSRGNVFSAASSPPPQPSSPTSPPAVASPSASAAISSTPTAAASSNPTTATKHDKSKGVRKREALQNKLSILDRTLAKINRLISIKDPSLSTGAKSTSPPSTLSPTPTTPTSTVAAATPAPALTTATTPAAPQITPTPAPAPTSPSAVSAGSLASLQTPGSSNTPSATYPGMTTPKMKKSTGRPVGRPKGSGSFQQAPSSASTGTSSAPSSGGHRTRYDDDSDYEQEYDMSDQDYDIVPTQKKTGRGRGRPRADGQPPRPRGRPKRKVDLPPPPKGDPLAGYPVVMPPPATPDPNLTLTHCLHILDQLMQHRLAWPFNTPVDPVALGIPDYPLIIKNPMDLGTIRRRLTSNFYKDVHQFAEDVRLVWRNALTYNAPGSDIYIMATTLAKDFEEKFGQRITPPVTTSAEDSAAYQRKQEMQQEIRELRDALKVVERQLVELRKQGAALAQANTNTKTTRSTRSSTSLASSTGGKNKPPKRRLRTDLNLKPMSYDEKCALSDAINALPAEHLPGVVAIVEEEMPQITQTDAEEIELDIDTLDTVTLRQLEAYVRDLNKKTQSSAASSASTVKTHKNETKGKHKNKDTVTNVSAHTAAQPSPTTSEIKPSEAPPTAVSSSTGKPTTPKPSAPTNNTTNSSSESSESSDTDSSSDAELITKTTTSSSGTATVTTASNSTTVVATTRTPEPPEKLPSGEGTLGLKSSEHRSQSQTAPSATAAQDITMNSGGSSQPSNTACLESTAVPKILPLATPLKQEVVLHNVEHWSQLDTKLKGTTQTETSRQSGTGTETSTEEKSEHDAVWSEFRNKGAQYKQRLKDREDMEEKQRQERERKERESRLEEERLKRERELKQEEEERRKAQEIERLREEERRNRQRLAFSQGPISNNAVFADDNVGHKVNTKTFDMSENQSLHSNASVSSTTNNKRESASSTEPPSTILQSMTEQSLMLQNFERQMKMRAVEEEGSALPLKPIDFDEELDDDDHEDGQI